MSILRALALGFTLFALCFGFGMITRGVWYGLHHDSYGLVVSVVAGALVTFVAAVLLAVIAPPLNPASTK